MKRISCFPRDFKTFPILVASGTLGNTTLKRNYGVDFEKIICHAKLNNIFDEENEIGLIVLGAVIRLFR